LQLVSDGKTLESIDLEPAVQHNLSTFATANKVPLAKMVDLAIRFTTAKEGHGPELMSRR